jgi:serine/threonine protein kinase
MMMMLDPSKWLGRKVVGRYRVLSEISRGGMGAVFLAVQEPLERHVALKIMLPGPAADLASRQRFIKEAQALSRIPHRNIVTIFDFGEADDGSLFIAMEHVDGINLRDALRKMKRVPWLDTVAILLGVAGALAVAHRSNILHRDLKPENVMLVGGRCNAEDVKLLDFGLARTLDSVDQLTQVNAIPGTPNYIAPERVVSRVEDPRSDLYAVGAIWFELLTGRLPFAGETMAAVLLAHIKEEVPALEAAAPGLGAPRAVEAMLRRLMAKKPEDRWPNADVLMEDLQKLHAAGMEQRANARAATAAPAGKGPPPAARAAPPKAPPTSTLVDASAVASSPSTPRVRFPSQPTPTTVVVPAGFKARSQPAPNTGAPASSSAGLERLPNNPALIPKIGEVAVGNELILVRTEWNAIKRAFASTATLRGRTLKRAEVPLPAGTPTDEEKRRMDAAHGWFVDEIRELLADRAHTQAPGASRLFFFAVEAYARGDKETALRTLETLTLVLPEDRRIKNSHMKLLLEMGG